MKLIEQMEMEELLEETEEELWNEIETIGPHGKKIETDKDIRDYFNCRKEFRKRYSYAIPTKDAISEIIKFSKNEIILEVGSGLGLWSFLIRSQGGSINPTDGELWAHYDHNSKRYIEVEKLEHIDAVKKYNKHNILMLCWPPWANPMAVETLKLFSGDKLIYIGEMDGCTGDATFQEELNSNWNVDHTIYIPVWDGLYDRVYLCSRKI